MEEIIKQIKEENLVIQKSAQKVKYAHMLRCDVELGNDIDVIKAKSKIIRELIEGIEKNEDQKKEKEIKELAKDILDVVKLDQVSSVIKNRAEKVLELLEE